MKVQNFFLAIVTVFSAVQAHAKTQDLKRHHVHHAHEVHNYSKGADFSQKYPKAHKFLKNVQAEHHPDSKVKIMMSHNNKRLISDKGDVIFWAESELRRLEDLLSRGEHRFFHFKHTLKVDLNHAKRLMKHQAVRKA